MRRLRTVQGWLRAHGKRLWVDGCRAPALQVLAMNLPLAPNLVRGLLASAGDSLQHLQLVMRQGAPYGQLWKGFWEEVMPLTSLAALQVIFLGKGE